MIFKKSSSLMFAGALLAWVSWMVFRHAAPAEDAVILYEYAKNLAERGIITYGGASHPIEGATDFLWMLAIAGFKWIGIQEFASALMLNCFGALYIVGLGRDWKEQLLLLAGMALTPYLYAGLSGFSVLAFSAVYVALLRAWFRGDRTFYTWTLLLCLVRPDGVFWSMGWVMLRLRRAFRAEWKSALLGLILPGLAYFFARWMYFSEFMPLPMLVKSGGVRDWWVVHSDSIRCAAIALLPLSAAWLFLKPKPFRSMDLALGWFWPVAFFSTMRLEQNIGNRFMAPFFFGGWAILSFRGKLRHILLFLALSAAVSWNTTRTALETLLWSKNENAIVLTRGLSKIRGKMLVTEAGRLAFDTHWQVHDSWGLNTPAYAHRLIRAHDLESERYDLIIAHCDLRNLFEPPTQPWPDRRSWQKHCEGITDFLRKNPEYEVWFLPYGAFSRKTCVRHEIGAIRTGYAESGEVRRIFQSIGAIRGESTAGIQGSDQVCPENQNSVPIPK